MKGHNIKNIVGVLVLVAALAVAFTAVGAGSAVAESTNDTYTVNLTANATGSASTLDVYVAGTDQAHDLLSNGTYSTTLSNGTEVTVRYNDGTTDTLTYTVGSGGVTAAPVGGSNATVDVTESVTESGGSGTTSDSTSIPGWLWKSIVGAIAVAFVFRVIGVED